jgi:SAM-dependent methyltransferase
MSFGSVMGLNVPSSVWPQGAAFGTGYQLRGKADRVERRAQNTGAFALTPVAFALYHRAAFHSRAARCRQGGLDHMTVATAAARVVPAAMPSAQSLYEVLAGLYRCVEPGCHQAYMDEHARPRIVRGQVDIFRRYLPHLPPRGVVLDWGCNHAPDSCLLRAARGDAYDLHGCDFPAPGPFEAFHDFAGLTYHTLRHVYRLPFPDDHFDAVISSGALEHAAPAYESLKELHRVLKPGAVLVLTYLPNWLSLAEWLRRTVWKKAFHRRLYSIAETRGMLLQYGFVPIVVGYLNHFWQRQVGRVVPSARWAARLAAPLQVALPVQILTSTLWAVARKVTVM